MRKVTVPVLRGKVYKILSTYLQYPDKDSITHLKESVTKDLNECLRGLPYGDELKTAYDSLASVIRSQVSTLESLQVEYTGLFITAFHDSFCPPYESIYHEDGRRLMGESTVSVKRCYNMFGLGVSQLFKDLPDHIAAELEFMYFLSFNEGKFASDKCDEERRLCIDYEKKFLEEHMLRWIPDFVECLGRSHNSEFFLNLSRFTREFVKMDARFLTDIGSPRKDLQDMEIESLEFDRSGLSTLEEAEVEPESERWVHTTSPERYWHSPVSIRIVNGRAVNIVAREDVPFFDGKQDVKAYAGFYKIYAHDRLKFPLKRVGERGEGKFKRISWEEALSEVSAVLGKYREEGHPEYVGFLRTHPPMEYMFNHFTHHYGSPNDLHTSTTSCYADGAIAQILTDGEYSDGAREDYLNSKYALFNGHTPPNALGVVTGATRYAEAVRRGIRTVIVDPRLNEGAYIYGAEWVPIEPGKDAAFLLGIMNVIIRERLYDEEFLLKHTNAPILVKPDKLPLKDTEDNYLVWDNASEGVKPLDKALKPSLLGTYEVKQSNRKLSCKTAFQLLAEHVKKYPPEEAGKICTVPPEKIEEIAKDLGKLRPQTSIVVGTVSAQYSNSLQYQRAKMVLISLLGTLDKPGGKHYGPVGRSGIRLNDPSTFRIPIVVYPMSEDRVDFDPNIHPFIFTPLRNYPIGIAQNFLKAILTGKPNPIKALFIIGSDVLSSHNPSWRDAFKKVDFIVKSHVWPDDDCDYADIILPEAAYLERDDGFAAVTVYDPDDMYRTFTFLTVIQKAVEPLFDLKSWHDYVKDLAQRLGFGEQYDFTLDEYWNHQLQPMGIDMEYLRRHGVYYPTPIITRKIEFGKKEKWPTETGRINLYSPELARLWHERGQDPIYSPLPTYFPITVEPKAENEFYFIQGKSPYFKCNFYKNNTLLLEKYLEGKLGNTSIWINSQRATRLGINNGDWVWVESEATGMKEKVRAKVTEGIHPTAIYAYYGYGRRSNLMDKRSRAREGVNIQNFVPEHYVPYTGGQAHCEAVVKVYKA